mgnify:CR=1 FL=1
MLTYICLEHVEASNGVVGDERNVIVVCTSRVLCVFVPRRLRGCPAFYPVMNGFFRPHIVAYTNLFTIGSVASSTSPDWSAACSFGVHRRALLLVCLSSRCVTCRLRSPLVATIAGCIWSFDCIGLFVVYVRWWSLYGTRSGQNSHAG